jgi:hypothetical protein
MADKLLKESGGSTLPTIQQIQADIYLGRSAGNAMFN